MSRVACEPSTADRSVRCRRRQVARGSEVAVGASNRSRYAPSTRSSNRDRTCDLAFCCVAVGELLRKPGAREFIMLLKGLDCDGKSKQTSLPKRSQRCKTTRLTLSFVEFRAQPTAMKCITAMTGKSTQTSPSFVVASANLVRFVESSLKIIASVLTPLAGLMWYVQNTPPTQTNTKK